MLVAVSSFVLAVLLAPVVAEIGLRLFAPVAYCAPLRLQARERGFEGIHQVSSVPGLEYELAPGRASPAPYFHDMVIHTNSHGMRGSEVALDKPGGVFRVACVGDSFTFGHGVEDEETYPAQLEARLDDEGVPGRFEVLNFGVSGYSTSDEAVQISARVLPFAPDVIVLGYVFNDPEEHPDHRLHRAFHEPRLWERSHLARRIAEQLWKRDEQRAGGYFELLQATDGPCWPSVERGFASIAASARSAGVPVVVAIFPLLSGTRWRFYRYEGLHRQVAALAEANGFAVCDLLPALRKRVPESIMLGDGDTHLNPAGDGVVAAEIARCLRERFPDIFASIGAAAAR